MLTFKSFLRLSESTQDLLGAIGSVKTKQLLSTKKDKDIQAIHDKVFGPGNHHLEIPLDHDVPDKVKDHVKSSGDKLKGDQVELKTGRTVPISKYLARSNAPKDVQVEHENYARNKVGNSKLVISRHPSEVASASCNTTWSSCANPAGDGPAANKLPNDIHHGTLIALHVHKDAKPNRDGEYDSKDVLGRTLIKRHDSVEGHTIFAPEGKSYGKFGDEAKKKTQEFANKHYPMRDINYRKHDDLYNDDGKDVKVNKNITHEYITTALKSKDADVRLMAIRHPKATGEHITTALKDPNRDVGMSAIKHSKVTTNHITAALQSPHADVRATAIKHRKATADHITIALKDPDSDVRTNAIKHPNATAEHISTILNNPKKHGEWVKEAAIRNTNATAEHISSVLNNQKDYGKWVRIAALQHPNATAAHMTIASKDLNADVRATALNRKLKA